jgi:hypothetical protein
MIDHAVPRREEVWRRDVVADARQGEALLTEGLHFRSRSGPITQIVESDSAVTCLVRSHTRLTMMCSCKFLGMAITSPGLQVSYTLGNVSGSKSVIAVLLSTTMTDRVAYPLAQYPLPLVAALACVVAAEDIANKAISANALNISPSFLEAVSVSYPFPCKAPKSSNFVSDLMLDLTACRRAREGASCAPN